MSVRIPTGKYVVTEGPGAPWRGKLAAISWGATADGHPFMRVTLKNAAREDVVRTDVLQPRVEVICYSIAEAVMQEPVR